MSSSITMKITLKSSDELLFSVDETVGLESKTMRDLFEVESINVLATGYGGKIVPFANVKGDILAKVIEYCNRHGEATGITDKKAAREELREFDNEFVNVDPATLVRLFLAASFMQIDSLHGLICQALADTMKGKTPEEVRTVFNMKNDYTPEEEEEVMRGIAWALE